MALRVTNNLKPGALFTTKGGRLSRLTWYTTGACFGVLDLRTGQEQSFGQDGEIAKSYEAVPDDDPHWIAEAAFQEAAHHIDTAVNLQADAGKGRRVGDHHLRIYAMDEMKKALRAIAVAQEEIRKVRGKAGLLLPERRP